MKLSSSQSAPRPKIGILALTLEYYEQLAPGLREGREKWLRYTVAPRFHETADVVFEGAAFTSDGISRAVENLERAGVDGLLVILLTYSPSQIALPALKRTRLPVLIWNTQELNAVTDSFTVAEMIDNHGVHGTQDLANVLRRAGVRFQFVTSQANDERAIQKICDFFIAARAINELGRLRIGLLGHPFPGMGDFAIDSTHLCATLGCSWVHLTIQDYIRLSAEAARTEIDQVVADYHDNYEIAEDVTSADLAFTARSELALRSMISQHRLGALSYQFLAFGEDDRVSTLPFVAASRLMAEGMGFGGEGDLVGAAGSTLLNLLQPPATFSEMFTIDFEGGTVFMSHMGEANVAMSPPDRRVKLVARPLQITPTRDRQLALVTTLSPGSATLFALTQGPKGNWSFVTSRVSIEEFGPLPDFYVPHFKLKPARPICDFLTDYAKAGGPHHNAVCFGDARNRIRFAAELAGADYIDI